MPAVSRRKTPNNLDHSIEEDSESEAMSEEELYGQNSPNPPLSSKPQTNRSRLKNLISLLSFLLVVIFVSSFTSFCISKFSSNIDFVQNISDVVGDFKKELKNERKVLLESNDNFDERIKSSLKDFFSQFDQKFAGKNFVQTKIQLLNDSMRTTEKTLKNDIHLVDIKATTSKKEYLKLQSQLRSLENTLTSLNTKTKALEAHAENSNVAAEAGRVLSGIGKQFKAEISDVRNAIKVLRGHVSDTSKGDFIGRSRFEREIALIKTQISEGGKRPTFTESRDGTEIDWAMAATGGFVISTGNRHNFLLSFLHRKSKSTLISPVAGPGDCLGFAPKGGYAVIGLKARIFPRSFTYESVSPSANPTSGSAPREIRVFALTRDDKLIDLSPLGGPFVYDGKTSSQVFRLNQIGEAVDRLRFEFTSNHGHREFTCVYRLRVHGDPVGAGVSG